MYKTIDTVVIGLDEIEVAIERHGAGVTTGRRAVCSLSSREQTARRPVVTPAPWRSIATSISSRPMTTVSIVLYIPWPWPARGGGSHWYPDRMLRTSLPMRVWEQW